MEPVEIFFFIMLVSLSTKTITEHDDNPTVKVNICSHENKVVYSKILKPHNTLFEVGTACYVKSMLRSDYIKLYNSVH